jgi:hypothetical protein
MMTDEDGNLIYLLARQYADLLQNEPEAHWNHDGYVAWAEQRLKQQCYVFLVWEDSTKPHGIGHQRLKDERASVRVGNVTPSAIPCESREIASNLQKMLLAPDPFDR